MRRPLRRILSADERQMLRVREQDIRADIETPMITMGPNGPVRVPDMSGMEYPQRAHAELQRTRRILEEGSAPDLTRKEVMERDKTIRILEDRIRKKLVPEKEFRMASDDSSIYRKVVEEQVRQGLDRELSRDIETLKNLKRERDPDNPSAGDIEYLRRT